VASLKEPFSRSLSFRSVEFFGRIWKEEIALRANLSDRRKPCLGPSRGGVNRRVLKSERPNHGHGIAAATVIIEPFVMNRSQRFDALVSPSYPKGLLSALKLLRSRRNYKGKEIPERLRHVSSRTMMDSAAF
jgi:hypothetical protein